MPSLRLLLAAFAVLCLFAQSSHADPIRFESISLEEARKQARSLEQFVFVDIYAEWCRPCKWMEENVFANDSVGDYLNTHFLSLRIDAEKEQQAYIEELAINAYPTLLIYDPKGRLVFRQEGALDQRALLDLTHSLVNVQQYLEDFKNHPKDGNAVANYALALRWINPSKASATGLKYLSEVKEKQYKTPQNWKLIKAFVKPSHRILFQRVFANDGLATSYGEEYKRWLQNSLESFLQEGKKLGKDVYLRQYLSYLKKGAGYFDNVDSLSMVAQLSFYDNIQDAAWCRLLITYAKKYGPKDHEGLARSAFDISKKHYQEALLAFAILQAKQSLESEPNGLAYIALAQASDKLGQYQDAYAYLLLSHAYLDESQKEDIEDLRLQLKSKSELALTDGVNVSDQSLGDDGRFTLGVEDKRLMFGYPLPESTSHFVINVDGKLGSNAPHLADAKFLRGLQTYGGTGATPYVTTVYEFEGIKLTQDLVPVDSRGQEIASGFAQYYKISYEFTNETNKPKKIGLGLLIDTMVDDNDFCAISADDQLLETEYGFLKKNMPSRLSFFRTKYDSTDLMGAAVLRGLGATTPDKLVVGRWRELHQTSWILNPQKVRYGDSAYFLKWENKSLSGNGGRSFVTYFGLPDHKQPGLRMIMNNERLPTEKRTVYFNHKSANLDLNTKVQLADLLYDDTMEIIGVLLKGYTDIVGQSDFNFELSKRRIAAVGNIFEAHGIPYVPKPYGMEKATATSYNNLFGNLEDRKVEVEIYYRLKAQQPLPANTARASVSSQ